LLTDARRAPVDTQVAQEPLRPPPRAPESVWVQCNVPRWLRRFDGVFHGTFNQLPRWHRGPSVVTIHDLSFEVHPEGFGAAKRWVFAQQARHAARVASRVIVPTDFTRRQLRACYGVGRERVVVTPWSIEARF